MKYIITIFIGAIIIGSLLAIGPYYLFGGTTGYFFAKFLAGPAGLVCSFVLFVVYDSFWPKKPGKSVKTHSSQNNDNKT